MMARFLFMNISWIDIMWKLFLIGGAAAVVCAFIADTSRYIWFVAHALVFLYGLHAMWVYRRRSDIHSIAMLLLVNIVWIAGFTLPFLLGHACLQVISFRCEVWWYIIASWVGMLIPAFYLPKYIHRLDKDLTEFIDKRHLRMFATRTTDMGFPGDYLVILPLTHDKSDQADTLESGRGQRHGAAISTRTSADLGEGQAGSDYDYKDDNTAYIRGDVNNSGRSGHSNGATHLRDVAPAGKTSPAATGGKPRPK
jgi:hypothetical protein